MCSDSSKQDFFFFFGGELFNASNEFRHSKDLLSCGSVKMKEVKYEPGPSSVGVVEDGEDERSSSGEAERIRC